MRYAVIGDVHGNLEALDAVLLSLKSRHIDEYLCIGDVVGYNADPRECIKIIKSLCPKSVAGNHDLACVDKFDIKWFKGVAKDALLWTKDILDNEEKKYLSGLNPVLKFGDITLVHGTLFEPEEFHYLTNLDYAARSFGFLDTKICFVGHTHIPAVQVMNKNREVSYSFDTKINLEDDLCYIVNVGSVGQPRDYDNRSCFCIYDTEEGAIEIERVGYDFRITQKKIFLNKLPEELAFRLAWGK